MQRSSRTAWVRGEEAAGAGPRREAGRQGGREAGASGRSAGLGAAPSGAFRTLAGRRSEGLAAAGASRRPVLPQSQSGPSSPSHSATPTWARSPRAFGVCWLLEALSVPKAHGNCRAGASRKPCNRPPTSSAWRPCASGIHKQGRSLLKCAFLERRTSSEQREHFLKPGRGAQGRGRALRAALSLRAVPPLAVQGPPRPRRED